MHTYLKFTLAAVCLCVTACSKKDSVPAGPEGPGPDNFTGWERTLYRAFIDGNRKIQRDTFVDICQFTFNADQSIRKIIKKSRSTGMADEELTFEFSYKRGKLDNVTVGKSSANGSTIFFEYEGGRLVRLRRSRSSVKFQYNDEGYIIRELDDDPAYMVYEYDWRNGYLQEYRSSYLPPNGNPEPGTRIAYTYYGGIAQKKMPFKSFEENYYVVRELLSREMALLSEKDISEYDDFAPAGYNRIFRKKHYFSYDYRDGVKPRRWLTWNIDRKAYDAQWNLRPENEYFEYYTFRYAD